jgi:hypothetical protein
MEIMTDPDPRGPKTYGSSGTLKNIEPHLHQNFLKSAMLRFHAFFPLLVGELQIPGILFFYLSRISDPGSKIEVLKKNLGQFSKNFRTFLPKKLSLSYQKYGFGIRDLRSGIRKKHIPDPGSRGQ